MCELVTEMQLGLSVIDQIIPQYFLNQPISAQDHLLGFDSGLLLVSCQGPFWDATLQPHPWGWFPVPSRTPKPLWVYLRGSTSNQPLHCQTPWKELQPSPAKGWTQHGLSRATSNSHLQQAQPKPGTLRKHLTSVSSDIHVLWTGDKRSLCNPLTFFFSRENRQHSTLPQRSHSLNCMLLFLVPSRLGIFCASSMVVLLHLIITETLSMIDSAIIVCILHAVPCWNTISFW